MTSITDYLESIKTSIRDIATHELRCDLAPRDDVRVELERVDHIMFTLADRCKNGEGLLTKS